MIFNCTSECAYPSEPFAGNVRRVAIDDHNVPTLETLVSFCRDLEERSRLKPEIVFAIHCRGGKGRTGLMVCAWLLWARTCRTANEALDLWARRRTDETIRGKVQGVQTMAQVRYVHYIEQLIATSRPLARKPRSIRRIVFANVLPDDTEAPEGSLPWIVISQVSPAGVIALDTKAQAGGFPSVVSQRGADIVIDLQARLPPS